MPGTICAPAPEGPTGKWFLAPFSHEDPHHNPYALARDLASADAEAARMISQESAPSLSNQS